MEEITLQVERDEQSGWLIAWWDDPVEVHFDEGAAPRRIRIDFVRDPILVQA